MARFFWWMPGPDVDLTQQDQDALFNSILDISSGL